MDKVKITNGVSLILSGLGVNLQDPNFIDTPDRIYRSFNEILNGMENIESKIDLILKSSFPCSFSQMILSKDIRTFSMCPHHLLPVDYKVNVAYIPSEEGKVLGISKLGRLVDILAKRLVLQEQFTDDITTYLMRVDGVKGAACVVNGTHYCMVMRGAKQSDSVTVTSSLKGVFLTDSKTRNEFTELLR